MLPLLREALRLACVVRHELRALVLPSPCAAARLEAVGVANPRPASRDPMRDAAAVARLAVMVEAGVYVLADARLVRRVLLANPREQLELLLRRQVAGNLHQSRPRALRFGRGDSRGIRLFFFP